jgi:hypothetical protein
MPRKSVAASRKEHVYSFPLLSTDDVQGCLAELSISSTADEIEKPRAEHIRAVYECLVEICVGVPRDAMHQMDFNASRAAPFEYRELHEESVSFANYVYQMCVHTPVFRAGRARARA